MSSRAERSYRKIRDKYIKNRIKNKLREISQKPYIGESLKGKLREFRKIRVRHYRIIYRTEKCKIIVIDIGHREGIYDKL